MKSAALVASLLLMALTHHDATGGSGQCQGKTVNVYLKSSSLQRGDLFSLPDTYIKLTVGRETRTTGVIPNNQTAVFKQWFVFKKAQSNVLEIQVWDEDGGLNGKDDFMGKCLIRLQKPGCRSFREVRERSAGFQGVAPAPVRPVQGTHDSGGISPAAPVLCSPEGV